MDPISPRSMLASFEPDSAYSFHQYAQSADLFAAVDRANGLKEKALANRQLDHAIARAGRGIPLLRSRTSFSFNPKRIQSLGTQANVLSLDFTEIDVGQNHDSITL